MKQIILFIVGVALVLSFTHCSKTNTNTLFYDKKHIKQVNKLRKEAVYYLSRNYTPGGAFAVAQDGKTIYSEARGWASKDLEVRANRNTKFRIGEVSELFTSIIYVKLIEEGVLHPDSSVQYYLNDFPQKEFKLTLNHLAHHSSGIFPANKFETNGNRLNMSLQKGLDEFKNQKLIFRPESYQELNTNDFNLLGAVMEKATGKKYSTLLKEYVTDTLHLENTVVDNPFITITNRSDFFDKNIVAQVVKANTTDLRHRMSSQGILSTPDDLIKFGNAILYSDYLSGKTHDKLFEKIKLRDGAPSQVSNGWLTFTDNEGRNVIGRGGSVTGGGGALIIYPDLKLVITGAVNITTDAEDIPVFDLAKVFFQKKEKEN